MGHLKNLAKQTAVYGISTIVAKFLSYLLTPYLTYIMTTGEYGVIGDFYSIIPFMLVLLTMGMETGFFRFAGKAEKKEDNDNVFRTTWGAVTVASVGFFILLSLSYRPLAGIMGYSATPSYLLLAGAIIVFDVVCAIPFARLREQGRSVLFVKLKIINVIITIVLCVFFYSVMPKIGFMSVFVDKGYLPGYFLIANLAASALMLPLLYPAYKGLMPRIDRKLFKTIFLYSLPLLISGIPGVANEFIDRQFIKWLLPEDVAMGSLGVYSAVVKLAVIITLFLQMYRYAAEPYFLGKFKKEEFCDANAAAMKYFIIISVFLFLFIALFKDLFGLMLGQDFREGVYILPIVLFANILAGIILNLSFWYKQSGKTNMAIAITIPGLAVTCLMNIILIPKMGYAAAAWVRLASEIAMVGISYALMRRYFPIDYDLKRIGIYILMGLALYAVSIPVARLPYHLDLPVNAVLIAVYVLYAVRKENIDVKQMIRTILKRN